MAKISDDVTQGISKSAARAMLRAVGLKDDDFNKFQVGIVSAGNEVTPCNLTCLLYTSPSPRDRG